MSWKAHSKTKTSQTWTSPAVSEIRLSLDERAGSSLEMLITLASSQICGTLPSLSEEFRILGIGILNSTANSFDSLLRILSEPAALL